MGPPRYPDPRSMQGAPSHSGALAQPPARGAGGAALGLILIAAFAVVVAAAVTRSPALALMIPVGAAGAFACARWPSAALVGLFVLTSAYGSLQAHWGYNARPTNSQSST